MKVTVLSGRLTKATANSAGWDVHSSEDRLLIPNEVVTVSTGLRVRMEGCWALVLDRSGLASKWGVSRRAGVIDPDYDKEWRVVMTNEGKEAYQIRKGDRIAQAVFIPISRVEVVGEQVVESDTQRVGGIG
jgi:dUTP pyrophosphatase